MAAFPEPPALQVIPTRGKTPHCWENRSVIFVANLLSLFFGNREGARLLEAETPCVDSYGGRLLPALIAFCLSPELELANPPFDGAWKTHLPCSPATGKSAILICRSSCCSM